MHPACAAVDWGTSSFRLWLLDAGGKPIASRRSGEGMRFVSPDGFASVLEAHLAALGASSGLPVVVCGMAGSRQGWVEARYAETPARLSSLSALAVKVPGFARDVRIVPGLAQRDRDRPDVMRGEETQLLGACSGLPGMFSVCLPGTHSKWVRMSDGVVTGFDTFMTGELFGAIGRHTILQSSADDGGFNAAAFGAAVHNALHDPAMLTANLFAIRAGELLGFSENNSAHSTLSGLLIGQEIAAAIKSGWTHNPVHLIASGELAARYSEAFAIAGISFVQGDAEESVISGLHQISQQLFGNSDKRRSA